MDLDDILKLILKDFVSYDFRCVNYKQLKELQFWRPYLDGQCIRVKDNDAQGSDTQRKAFFINLYNVLCIYAVCLEEKMPSEISKIRDVFDKDLCIVGEERLSLDDILHGILRANSPHPASRTPYFGSNSSKSKFSLKAIDPRILFACNSADLSSPPIRHFTAADVDRELDTAVCNFVAAQVSWNAVARTIVVPRLLLWYRRDFPGGHDVATVRWAANYLNDAEAMSLRVLVDELEFSGGVRIIHNEHDFRLNQYPPVTPY